MHLDPTFLPDIESLRRRSQALAMLDAILCPEWQYRYYSFNTGWTTATQMGSMRNGCGDDWFILFGAFGAAIKGLANETAIGGDKVFASEVQRQVPPTFTSFLAEPAFGMDWLSYCYWRAVDDASWQRVVHPYPALAMVSDGSTEYLAHLVKPATAYAEFARDYYEVEIPLDAIESIYNHSPLTEELVQALNPEVTLAQVQEDVAEIGYPATELDASRHQ